MTARVLVTGASQGIGNAILLKLARSGHSVLGVSRTQPEGLAALAPSLGPSQPAWKALDLSNTTGVAQCAAALGPVAIRALVLCAADYGSNGRHPASETTSEEWHQVIATNCIGHCVLVSHLLPKLLTSSPATIVSLSSDVALLPGPGRAAYAASKAGLHAMLRAVAAEHSHECLRVYQLIPTFQLVTSGIRRRRPAGFDFSSYGDPAVIAEVVTHLLSPSGSDLTPGTYLVRRDGTTEPHPESAHL